MLVYKTYRVDNQNMSAEKQLASHNIPEEWSEEQKSYFFAARRHVLLSLHAQPNHTSSLGPLAHYDTTHYEPIAIFTLLEEGMLEPDMVTKGVRLTEEGQRLAVGMVALSNG